MSVIYNMDIKTDLHVQALGFHGFLQPCRSRFIC